MKDHRIMEVSDLKLTQVAKTISTLKEKNPDGKYAIENIDGQVWIVEDI